ncbi:ATP-binding protein [Yimella sp. RIT 621]|uniref:ATP-binding protein n=1 Tax=Yimella sp. RIT 621 TaxID=2510323 RepID=UPI00101D8D3F|nr:ATP-binding protein [Yimella sp. RIT 621]RYG76561.1 ATP-binding protein [Yimella sp. RIT 621]
MRQNVRARQWTVTQGPITHPGFVAGRAQVTVRAADAENPVHFVRSHLQLELGRFWIWPTQLSSYPRVSIYEATTRSLLIACAVICLSLAAASGRPSSVTVALGIVLLGSLLVMARRATRVFGMAGLLLGLCLTPLAGFANASQLVGLAFALIASQLRIVPALVVLTTWFGCFVAAYLSSPYAADTAMLVDHGVLSLGCIMAIAICHHLLVHRIVRLDRVRSREFELELAQRLRDDEKRAGESARRVLHDQVLFTLIRIADSGGVECDVVQRTLGAFDLPVRARGDVAVDLLSLVDSCVPSGVSVTPSPRARRPVPTHVADALRRALGEALRNAARHGDGPAQVDLALRGDDVEIRVRNRTASPGSLRPGWGWRNCVERELNSIGGSASLRRDGADVVVTLTLTAPWFRHGGNRKLIPPAQPAGSPAHPAGSPAHPAESPDRPTGSRARPAASPAQPEAVWAAWPALIAHTFIAWRHTPGPQLAAQSVVVAAVWLMTWWLTRAVASGRLTRVNMAAVAAASAASASASLAIAGPQSLHTYASWGLGMAGVPLCVIAFFGSARRVLFLTVCGLAPALAVVGTHPEITWMSAAGALMTGLCPWLTYAIGRGLRQVQTKADRDEAAVRERLSVATAVWSEERVSDLLSFTKRTVRPFLHRISTDGLQAADRITAGRLAAQVRDELNLPGVLDAALRDRIATARELGAEITIHPAVDPCPDRCAVLLRVLDRLLDDAAATDRLELRLGGAGEPCTVSLLAPDAEQRLRALATLTGSTPARLTRDAFATTLVLGPSPDHGMAASTTVG